MIAEGRVLLGVEHLEHRARRVAAEVRAHLVDLVDHQHRVVRAGVAQRAHDRAGHRADVGPAVAADLGLVAHAAHRDALELALHGRGDRAAERGLPHTRRADEQDDRAARLRIQLADREELENAVLHAVDVVVVAVEHATRVLQIEVVLGRLRPRQRGDPLQVAADHAVLGRLRRQPLEARQLSLRDRPGVLRQVRLLELPAELLGLGLLLVDLAQLLLDRAELLAEEVLALAALHLGMDLGLDPAADLDQLELAGEDLGQEPQPPRDVALLEQALLLLGLDPERAGDQVSELDGVVEVRDRELELLGQVGQVLDDPREGRLDVAAEALELGRGHELVGRLGDVRDQVRRRCDEVAELHALAALHEDVDRAVGHLHHPRDHSHHAHAVELVRPGFLGLRLLRGDHHQHPVAGEHVVDERDRALLADREREHRVREGDAVAQRQDRQRLRQLRLGRGRHGRRVCGSPFTVGTWMVIAPRSARAVPTAPARRAGSRPGARRRRTRRSPRRPPRRRRAPRRAGRGRARSRSAGRAARRPPGGAPLARDHELAAADLERHVGRVDRGEIDLDDRARRVVRVVDVDARREAAAAQPAALEGLAEQLVHLAPHALEVGEQVALRGHRFEDRPVRLRT